MAMNTNDFIFNKRANLSVIENEGLSTAGILQKLQAAGIGLNEYAWKIFNSPFFNPSLQPYSATILECAVLELGLTDGGNFAQISQAIEHLHLTYCPAELAPYIRLAYMHQPASTIQTVHQSPPGAITVFSKPLQEEDDFPKGFYLRNYDHTIWLRGYTCDNNYHWKPVDRMIFLVKTS